MHLELVDFLGYERITVKFVTYFKWLLNKGARKIMHS